MGAAEGDGLVEVCEDWSVEPGTARRVVRATFGRLPHVSFAALETDTATDFGVVV